MLSDMSSLPLHQQIAFLDTKVNQIISLLVADKRDEADKGVSGAGIKNSAKEPADFEYMGEEDVSTITINATIEHTDALQKEVDTLKETVDTLQKAIGMILNLHPKAINRLIEQRDETA